MIAPGGARSLEWDAKFFGFPVAAIETPRLSDPELRDVLEGCRRAGIRLAFWGAERGRVAPPELLESFGGAVVDRKLTFSRELPDPAPCEAPREIAVEEVPPGPADPALRALALVAGGYSRFRVDPRMPAGKFEELYALWMDRSCRREMADAVLAARAAGETAGMVTVALEADLARIGLVAVAAGFRGRGVGRSLLGAAHLLMERRGARVSSVVTQAANSGACALYERSGYRVTGERSFHHFWLA